MLPAPKPRRSPLLGLAYGAGLTLALATAVVLVALVGTRLSAVAVASTVDADRALIREFLASRVLATDLEGPLSTARRAELSRALATLTTPVGGIQQVTLYAPDARPIASSGDSGSAGSRPPGADLAAALGGEVRAALDGGPPPAVLHELLPITVGGAVRAVAAVERDGRPVAALIDAGRWEVLLVVVAGIAALALLLYLIFRAAQAALSRQAVELVEATHRDPVTGLPNHGAAVTEVSLALDDARRAGGWLVVALIDIDNFGLFNTSYGHEAGDSVLRAIADVLRAEAPADAIYGRFGPDEFLLSGPPACAHQIRPAAARIRTRLADVGLRFGDSDRLPVTISVGISSFPEHAGSVTELLAAATVTLREAKVSGGDTIRVDAPALGTAGDQVRAYSVLEGLVTAIDTKDHYTRRHSEEVAHYALLLADELELDEGLRRALRLAALLHDVGKIGIPDEVLRKPGVLTDAERAVMQQHPVIGDLIVRGLPDLELVCAGVRHHHERWDGGGYPDGLRGEEIPRIARMISVADAFSAMTTSRTYRAARSTADALAELEAVAGTQLDASLARGFLRLLSRRPQAFLGTGDLAAARLWSLDAALA